MQSFHYYEQNYKDLQQYTTVTLRTATPSSGRLSAVLHRNGAPTSVLATQLRRGGKGGNCQLEITIWEPYGVSIRQHHQPRKQELMRIQSAKSRVLLVDCETASWQVLCLAYGVSYTDKDKMFSVPHNPRRGDSRLLHRIFSL